MCLKETKIILLTMSSYTHTRVRTHTHTHSLINEPVIQRIRSAPLIRTFTFPKAIKITRRHNLNENRTTSIKLEHVQNVISLAKAYEIPSMS